MEGNIPISRKSISQKRNCSHMENQKHRKQRSEEPENETVTEKEAEPGG